MGEGSPPAAVMNPLEIELLLRVQSSEYTFRLCQQPGMRAARTRQFLQFIALRQPTSRGYNTTLQSIARLASI